MKRTFQTSALIIALLVPASASLSSQNDQAKSQKYQSKYKKRGDVHGIVVPVAYPIVYEAVTRAFANLGLTINYEEPALGFIEGGRSRGVAGEMVRVWIDPEEKEQYRVEVRNLRLSRMGLIGFAATKDWSIEVLDAVKKELGDSPAIAQLRSAVDANPDGIDARRRLIDACIARGQLDDAAEAYRALLSKNPGSDLDRVKFSELLLSRGQPDEAIEILKQQQRTNEEAIMHLARIDTQTERSLLAVELLTPLAQGSSADVKVRYQLARAAYLAGDLARSKATFSAVIGQAPQHPFAEQARLWLRVVEAGPISKPPEAKMIPALCELLIKERLDLLAQHYLEAAMNSASGTELAQIERMLSGIYSSHRQYASITRMLQPRAEQLMKDKQGELIYALAMAHCGMRDFKSALENLKRAKKAGYRPPKDIEQALKTYQ